MPSDVPNLVPPQHGRALEPRMRLERRVLSPFFWGLLPALLVALVLLWLRPLELRTRVTLSLLVVGGALAGVWAQRERLITPLRTISNLLGALREGDTSLRARHARSDDAFGEVLVELNAFGDELRAQRLAGREAGVLLERVLEQIDVGVFVFDARGELRLVNRRGAELAGRPRSELAGRTAGELGLAECLALADPGVLELELAPGRGRYLVRRSAVRERGEPHELVVLSDIGPALRAEERQAWQRLIQVLRHEINNSLAPIHSLAGSLRELVGRDPRPADFDADLGEGLGVVAQRSKGLMRFMAAYARLTKLPPPKKRELDLAELARRVAGLEQRLAVALHGPAPYPCRADPDQLEQLLINLVNNAVEAALATGGGVRVAWSATLDGTRITVDDDGPGLPSPENLFVPFFTTKPGGTGIGLVLSREIAEAHGGTLTLEDRAEGFGCRATVVLPAK
jgi:nitrogen fixation/metabolism regulation signal transduction histidine kinase